MNESDGIKRVIRPQCELTDDENSLIGNEEFL